MEHNAKRNCETIISGKEQNLNKQMAEFGIFRFFKYFMYILTNFNTFSRSQKPVSQLNTFQNFNTARKPRLLMIFATGIRALRGARIPIYFSRQFVFA